MTKYSTLLILVFAFLFINAKGQSSIDSLQLNKEFINLEEALKNPENVYRLNLSEQEIEIADTIWSKFTNLQYLSLKNDHLKQIPDGLGNLKTLKVLDLSGNDFKVLPPSFSNLINLEELFINDDKYFRLDKNIPILSKLPNLKTLHLENDGLKSLPKNTSNLIHIESLYLNNNEFKELPKELNGLDSLKYIDFHDNKFNLPPQEIKNKNFGIKIRL
jgi:Leucine-rich repeat (LRR) protein